MRYLFACTLVLAVAPLAAQFEDEGGKGFTLYEKFQGSGSTLGLVTKLDSTAGYRFNRFVELSAGIPVYFIRPSDTAVSTTGLRSANGIGNAYLQARLTVANPAVNYISTLTGTAPTGDRDRGLSTGRPTYDWNNHFERTLLRLTPFANVGIANTISDTPFFVRPFSSLGFVSHLEAGAGYRLWGPVGVGASAYAIEPAGQQTLVSKVITTGQGGSSAQARGRGRPERVFETASTTSGPAEIARDNGLSLWFEVHPSRYVDLEAGYTRSIHYALDTVSFGIGLNLNSVLRKER